MCELTDRAGSLESKLRDLDCETIEVSLAAARLLLVDALTDDGQEASDVENCRLALTGAIVIAEAVVEQLSTRPRVYALDGDVQFGPYSYAPGRMCTTLRDGISAAEREAKAQRDQLLMPVVKGMITNAQRETLADLGVAGLD
jgi:hypothetical protein